MAGFSLKSLLYQSPRVEGIVGQGMELLSFHVKLGYSDTFFDITDLRIKESKVFQ
jgi:hypothetical protein